MKRIFAIFMIIALLLPCMTSCIKDDDLPEEESTHKNIEYADLVADGATAYKIVVSRSATEAVNALSSNLAEKLNKLTGVKIDRITDDTKKNPASKYEIQLGISNRNESKNLYRALSKTGYRIKFTDNKLVVVATNDDMLNKAIEDLFQYHVVSDNGSLRLDSSLDVIYDGLEDMLDLFDEEGNFRYQIIYPEANENGERAAADELRRAIRDMFDCNIEQAKADTSVAVNDDSYEILIGKTNRSQSNELYSALPMLSLESKMIGNKIAVGAGIAELVPDASKNLKEMFSEIKSGSYDGKYLITKTLHLIETLSAAPPPEKEINTEGMKRILIVSDPHHCQKTWYGVSSEDRMEQMVKQINEEYEKDPFEFILFLGDYSLDHWLYGGSVLSSQKSYTKEFVEKYCSQLPTPYYMIAGNHEQYGQEAWEEITGFERELYIVKDNYLFILWDSYAEDLDPTQHLDGTYTPMPVEKIQTLMSQYPDKKVVLISHYFDTEQENRDEVKALLKDERIVCLFAGHTHQANVWNLGADYGNKKVIFGGNYSYQGDGVEMPDYAWGFREIYLNDTSFISRYIVQENEITVDGELVYIPYSYRDLVEINY